MDGVPSFYIGKAMHDHAEVRASLTCAGAGFQEFLL